MRTGLCRDSVAMVLDAIVVIVSSSIKLVILVRIGSIGAEISMFQLSMNRDRNKIKIDYYNTILLGLQN